MIGAIRDAVNAISADRGLPQVTSGIVIAVDYAPAAKATLLLFGADGRPRLVAKLARQPEAEPVLLAEHSALAEVWSSAPTSIAGQLPSLLGLERVGGRLVLLSSALPGIPMSTCYYRPGHARRPRRVKADFAAAGSWLARFQEETRSGTATLGPGMFDEWIRPVFDRYRAAVGWSDWESDLLRQISGLCGELAGTPIPVVAVHGDYAPGNILVQSGQVSGVVDWELGRGAGLPFSDLFKWAASYGSYLDRACPPRRGAPAGHPGWSLARDRWGSAQMWTNGIGIMYAFFGTGWLPELARAYLGQHLSRLAVPPAAAHLFLPVFLAEQALALEQPAYRDGYRGLLRLLCEERAAGRLRSLEAVG